VVSVVVMPLIGSAQSAVESLTNTIHRIGKNVAREASTKRNVRSVAKPKKTARAYNSL